MKLRLPQREALECFHNILDKAEMPLSQMSREEVCELFKEANPKWTFEHETPEFTFNLATGVGKTRLIGALIAYLFVSGESKDFMIVSPRSEIIRKFINVCNGVKDYLFVDEGLIDFPSIFHSESNVADYEQGIIFGGPRIWILSPQSLTANNARMKFKGQFDSCTPVEYLRKLDDLVVFFDESHHLGLDSEEDSVWRAELNGLNPKMIIGTTASVSDDQNNILYSYPLSRCLNEHKYTKFVRMLPDRKLDAIDDEEYDHITLRFALQQLSEKQKHIDDYCRLNNTGKHVKAAMLVACENIAHAESVAKWLQKDLGSKNAVLLVHSKLNENEYVDALKRIEASSSPVKVVVNVGMLNEGWDVSNIYVIAPLRAMASTTLVTQIMGRGLRLPFGAQTGDDDVDTLDVLCFGRETMQEIVTKLTKDGFGTGKSRGISVDSSVDSAHPTEEFVPKKKIKLKVVGGENILSIPQYQMVKQPLPIDQISIPPLKSQEINYFLINDPKTIKKIGNTVEFEREEFLRMVTTGVIRQCQFLNYSRHFAKIKAMVDQFLNDSHFTGETVNLLPERVISHIKDCLEKLDKLQRVEYHPLAENIQVDLNSIQICVPRTYKRPKANTMPFTKWSEKNHKGLPFGGWKHSVYEAVPFDTGTEYHIAHIIDTADEIKSWCRNLPGILALSTPVGDYLPNFLLRLADKTIFLKVKEDDNFGKKDPEATIKDQAAHSWCTATSEATGTHWEYRFVMDSDARDCQTFGDIMEYSETIDED